MIPSSEDWAWLSLFFLSIGLARAVVGKQSVSLVRNPFGSFTIALMKLETFATSGAK